MRKLYDLLSRATYAHLQIAQGFSKKLKLFVQGRKSSFPTLTSQIQAGDKTIWFHCASLGEFEQGVPIMESLRKDYPECKILVTFFSPSGYEIKKNTPLADTVVYLPFDTQKNARKFLEIVNPVLALFIKYEIWPNYLLELQLRNIPTLLVSGLFSKKQVFFKSHGGFMRSALKAFDHFFVQDRNSVELLNGLGIENVSISGDTRFDRVSHQIEQDNSLDFMDAFKGNSLCLVCGSTWPEDEGALLPYINDSQDDIKFVLAPHKIEPSKIEDFRKKLAKPSVLYSEREGKNLNEASVLIVDTIGLLSKIYSYADIAYVGGAMGSTGLHNILEPATFGVPIIIGNNFDGFPEAKRLQQLAGLFSISNETECSDILNKLVTDKNFRNKTGMICGHFVNSNTGATRIITQHITQLYANGLV
ncbi:glycosyltransferase N-terminal domain-containing protein [Aureisphaera galaxeae]|uniref:3-deoxy-D-manno-octulosonic acid transferase n=1 Tax=Aureisphaera galaxeae TaxID=1538023 RepID=UPI00235073F0|nr:glycosyltransferase N-terminal domain-containing protein [Aureisphaera galaxeae]MDC8003353.1 glycosyltransferase N-terminal domain-containing protein [Aureisphaera galaxeae]